MASSLKVLCLDLIVQEFGRFHFAFTVSKDETLQRNFEFLRRKFSSELVSSISRKAAMKVDYTEFLINKHVTFFHAFGGFLKDNVFSLKDIFFHLPNLTEIFFFDWCRNTILENIAKFCPKIVLIEATFSRITDNGIKYLCRNENGKVPCPELKILGIVYTRVTPVGVKNLLQSLPSLEILEWNILPKTLYSSHEGDLAKLENVCSYNLIKLNFFRLHDLPYYTDLLKICLTVCPKLKSVSCCITDISQLSLFNHTSLEKIYLRFLKSGPNINISSFLKRNGINLVYLKIRNCTMSISDLALYCPKIKELSMANITFPDDYNSQPIFNCLYKCTFQKFINDQTTSKAISFLLLYSPKVESIWFRNCSLSPDIKIHILKFCESKPVKEITFEGVFEMSFVKDIFISCLSLVTLNLVCCNVNDNDEKELKSFAEILPSQPRIAFYKLRHWDRDYSKEIFPYLSDYESS